MERKPYYGSGNRSSRPGAGRPGSASPSSARNQSSSRTRAQGSVRAGSRPSAQRTREGAAYRQSAQRSAANRTSRTASARDRLRALLCALRRRAAARRASPRGLIPLASWPRCSPGASMSAPHGSSPARTAPPIATTSSSIGIDVSSYGRAEGAWPMCQSQVDARLSASHTLTAGRAELELHRRGLWRLHRHRQHDGSRVEHRPCGQHL